MCLDMPKIRSAKNLTTQKCEFLMDFLDVEGADRLPPFKSETPESRKNSRFWAGSDYTRHLKHSFVNVKHIKFIESVRKMLENSFFRQKKKTSKLLNSKELYTALP